MPFVEGKMRSIRRQAHLGLLVLAGVLLGGSMAGDCQAVYGSLYGTVTDNTGAIVPNAKVTVTDVNKGTQIAVETNSEGFWQANNLIPDIYSIKVEGSGFTPGQAEGVELHAGTSQKI